MSWTATYEAGLLGELAAPGEPQKGPFATAEERAVFVQTWLRDGKPALWETNSRGQRIIRMERNGSSAD